MNNTYIVWGPTTKWACGLPHFPPHLVYMNCDPRIQKLYLDGTNQYEKLVDLRSARRALY